MKQNVKRMKDMIEKHGIDCAFQTIFGHRIIVACVSALKKLPREIQQREFKAEIGFEFFSGELIIKSPLNRVSQAMTDAIQSSKDLSAWKAAMRLSHQYTTHLAVYIRQ